MAESVETAVYRLRVEGQDQLDRMTKSIEGLAIAEEDAVKATRTTSDELQKRVARYDPLIRAQQAYSKELQNIARYQETGVGTQKEINALFEGATNRYQAAQEAAKGLGDAHVGMTGQAQAAMHAMRGFFESVAMGTPITQAMTQHLSQLSYAASGEGGIVGAFKQVGSMISGMVTPMTATVAGLGAIAAAAAYAALQMDKAAVAQQRIISGAGTRTGTTGSDITTFVAKNAPSAMSGTTLSTTESRALAETMTQTGNIVISQLHNMSDAVLGFANQSQKSVSEVTKVFGEIGKDPVKAMDQIEQTMGAFSQKTRDIVDDAIKQGDATRAANAVIDEMNIKLKNSAGNMDVATQAGRELKNMFGTLFSASAGTPLEKQLESVRQKLSEVIEEASRMPPEFISPAMKQNIIDLSNKFQELYQRQQNVLNSRATAVFDDIAAKARVATDALIPQNKQIEEMGKRLNELKTAQAAGAGGPDLQAAITAQENMLAKTRESKDETARLNERVKEISRSWGDVGQATALALQAAQNNLPVIEAVGGAAKMAAQYAADYKNAMDAGKTATEAAALAASNLAAAQAAVNSAARETLFNLQNQAASAGAVTGQEKIAASAAATYNKMVHDGVSANTAAAVATQQKANAESAETAAKKKADADAAEAAAQQRRNATANVLKQVEALKDSTEMIKAQTADLGTGAHNAEMMAAAGIAYKNAIESGASETAAAALSSETLANYMAKAANSAMQLEQTRIDAAMAEQNKMNDPNQPFRSEFDPNVMPKGTLTLGGGAQVSYRGGGPGKNLGLGPVNIEAQWKATQEAMKEFTDPTMQQLIDRTIASGGVAGAIAAAKTYQGGTSSDQISMVGQLTQLQNQQTTDKALQAGNLQSELTWLQSQPASVAREQAIADLRNSIVQLQQSTDTLNSTNQTTNELLSPYYTQDPRTSHIGFRSQGMALGGYVDVPGSPSSNDNMIATIPVASGERIFIDPMNNRRSTGSGSGTVINISSPITINGNANADQFGRTLFQANQQLAKQVRAATQ